MSLRFQVSLCINLFTAAAAVVLIAAPVNAQSLAASSSAGQIDADRLGAIGYRLATANAERCVRPEMQTGMVLHDQGGYDAAIRPQVARAYGLGAGFAVLRLVPGSSAERAGLKRGDEIVAMEGRDVASFAPDLIGARASPDRTERFADLLDGALRQGPATLSVKRGGTVVSVSLVGEKGCGGRLVVASGDELNAWTDGRYVAVTARMMRFAADDQELAFVVAHEMSHNILGHTEKGATRGKAAEAEADTLAIELLARAGFDLTAPARFLRRSARTQLLALPFTHPDNSKRARMVNASITRLDRAARPASTLAAGCSAAAASAPIACLIEGEAEARAGSRTTPSDDAWPAEDAMDRPHRRA